MGEPLGLLKVVVVQGKGLVIRDFKSSDPYVVLRLGGQTLKTKVINCCLNPVWNEELTLSLTEPAGVLQLEVFDKDRFKADDKMGHAHVSLQPLGSAARLRHILGVAAADGSTLRKVIPESDNCLLAESSINWNDGEVVQDVWLRLCGVKSGEIELKIKLTNLHDAPTKGHLRGVRQGEVFLRRVCAMNLLNMKRLRTTEENNETTQKSEGRKEMVVDLGDESQVVYIPKFLSFDDSWNHFHFLNKHIPWTRPTIRVFGRSFLQPRDTCYVASGGVTELVYSGYKPHAHSWDDFPPLKDILDAVHKALPGSSFNSLLLNRYKGGDDYVGWHADDEKLYGPMPEIASISFGCERDFLLKKKHGKMSKDQYQPSDLSTL